MEQYGIDVIKKAIKFGLNLQEAIRESLKDDGHISGMEYFKIAGALTGIIPIVTKISEIENEYNDLSTDEKTEINDYFAKEFDLPNDVIEVKIEKAFALIVLIVTGVDDMFEPPVV